MTRGIITRYRCQKSNGQGNAAKHLKAWRLLWRSNGGDVMNWTTLALVTNALIWAVMFADILHDLYKEVHNGKD